MKSVGRVGFGACVFVSGRAGTPVENLAPPRAPSIAGPAAFPIDTPPEVMKALGDGQCDVFTADQSALYGEVFERDVGARSKLGIPRGLNQSRSTGGILHAPLMR